MRVAVVDDHAFGIVVGFLFQLLDDVGYIGRGRQGSDDLLVLFQQFDGVEALQLLGNIRGKAVDNARKRFLGRSREGNRRCRGSRADGLQAVHYLIDALVAKGGNLDNVAAQLFRQRIGVDLVAALAHNVHHVDGDDHRNAHFQQLGGEVQVAFQVAAVDDVQNRIGLFLDKEVTRNNFFEGIRGKGVDAREVGDLDGLVVLELATLLLYGYARPVANVLVGTGKRVEQGCFAAVRVAGKCNSHSFLHSLLDTAN